MVFRPPSSPEPDSGPSIVSTEERLGRMGGEDNDPMIGLATVCSLTCPGELSRRTAGARVRRGATMWSLVPPSSLSPILGPRSACPFDCRESRVPDKRAAKLELNLCNTISSTHMHRCASSPSTIHTPSLQHIRRGRGRFIRVSLGQTLKSIKNSPSKTSRLASPPPTMQ